MSAILITLLALALAALGWGVGCLARKRWRNSVVAALVCANSLTLMAWLLADHARVHTIARLQGEERKVGSLESRIRELESVRGQGAKGGPETRGPAGYALAAAPSWPGEITIRRERRGEALLYVVGFAPSGGAQVVTARPKRYPKVHLAWHRGGEFQGSFFRPGTLASYTLEPGFAELSFELLPKDDPHIFIFYGEGRKECAPDYVFASQPDSAFLTESKRLPVPGDFEASLNELVMDIFRTITKRHPQSMSRDTP